ncbi:MAG TPA: divalent-cation tolerance protein CutA [Verrucomicrobiae bacterium]|nr:divalent-cation tolerance protein CutA [Verrucomicrobiae bacterium]
MEKVTGDIRVVLISVPDIGSGVGLARALLEERAVACVNLMQGVESLYWWEGRIEQSAEILLVAKTVAGALESVERVVRENHPYECPEILALPVAEGAGRYLSWLRESVRARE